jgi:hypothetical protein
MSNLTPRAYQVPAKTQQVVDYHYDESRPGKPLYLLIPGGIIALICLVLEYVIAYRSFFEQSMDSGQGLLLMLVLAPFYIGGVFLFSYGYELYDIGKALRLTAIIVFISVAAVVIVAALFALAGGGSGKRSSSSSSSSSSNSDSSSHSGGGLNTLAGGVGSFFGGSSSSGGGPVFVNLGGPLVTHEVTREVVHDHPVEPAKPLPFPCPNCGRPYMPSETHYACPNCGAPTPAGLFACRNCGTQYVPADHNFVCPTCGTPTPAQTGNPG